MTNEINLIFNIDGRLFTFVFAPCPLVVHPWSTPMCATSLFLHRFWCCLFEHVALCLLSFPLCLRSQPCTPSSSFLQRAAALPSSFHFTDPPAYFSMLPCFLCPLKTLESLPYVFPRFSNLKHTIWPFIFFVITFHICYFSLFKFGSVVNLICIASHPPLQFGSISRFGFLHSMSLLLFIELWTVEIVSFHSTQLLRSRF